MTNTKHIFISTSIPYVNAVPHIGHAVEFIQADIIARYRRMRGDDIFFLSGTDDNALKNVLEAEKAGQSVALFVEKNANVFRKLLTQLNISTDDFIRTSTDSRHTPGAQRLWSSFKPTDMEKKKYRGLYCVGCEEFKTEKDLTDRRCPEHPNVRLEYVEEENYFFKLGHYESVLKRLIESDTLRIVPETRKNEILEFIRGGLEDLSISRSAKRARGWGVPVPGDPEQMQYVWVDALSNYITALDYAHTSDAFKRYWKESSERIHVIGKGISRFHAVYWPAFLLSAGVPLPTTLFVHGYITVDGQKMSKSLGNVIDPFALVAEYGTDAVRHFLAQHVHPYEDTDITMERFKLRYESDLVDDLGNLVARIMQMAQTHLNQPVRESAASPDDKEQTDYHDKLAIYRCDQASDYVFRKIRDTQEEIDKEKPFKLIEENQAEGKKNIIKFVQKLRKIATLLEPFMPETSKKIIEAILANKKPANLFPRKE